MISGSPGGSFLISGSNSPTHPGAPTLTNSVIKSGILDKEVNCLESFHINQQIINND
jgi:hypothetical protein